MQDRKRFPNSLSKNELINRLYENGIPSEHGLPSVKQTLKRAPSRDTGLSIKNRGGSQVRLQPTLDKIASAKLAGASPAIIDPIQLEVSTQRETEDRITAKQRKRLFAGIEDVQQQQTDPMLDEDESTYRVGRTYGVENKGGFFGSRASSSGLKPGTTSHLVGSKSLQLLKPLQNQLKLKIPKQPLEAMSQSQFEGNQWQDSVKDQLQRFKSSQHQTLVPKKEEQNTIALLRQTNSMKSFSNLHPQFRPLNCDPYTRERFTQFGFMEGQESAKTFSKKPTSKMAVSLTGEKVMQALGPSQHLHKMTVPKPSQTGQIVGSGSIPFIRSDLQEAARQQTKQLRLKLQDGNSQSTSLLRTEAEKPKFADRLRASARESRNSGVDGKSRPDVAQINPGQVPLTEEILRKHYFMAKISGKTTFQTLEKEMSPQKHMLQTADDFDSEQNYQQVFLSKREQQNEEFALANLRATQMEKLQQQAASFMRLNAVWGLEPNENAVDIRKAKVINEAEGVVYQCVSEDRKLSVNELGDSDLDQIIYYFQLQPEDDHYFIYCDQNPDSKDPYDLRPLVEFTEIGKTRSKFSTKGRPHNQDKFYTLSKNGFTLYRNMTPVEYTPLSEWLLERRYYRQIRNKDFFKNFRTWSIMKMWRRNVLQKHREQIKAILQTKLFAIDDVFGPILIKHRRNCKEMESNRIIDLKTNNIEVATYEEFEQKQRDRRRNVTRVVQEKSDECRKYFKMGIDTVLNRLRAKINEQTEEEDKKNEYIKKTDEVQQPRQIVNANPILDALGFNHSLKYGNRSKLRSACMRFLRFSYLLDFVATEALTNIYLFSVDETIRKLEQLSKIKVRYDITDGRQFTFVPSMQQLEPVKKRQSEVRQSIHEMPFFKVRAAINSNMMKMEPSQKSGKNKEQRKIKIPKQFLYKEMISEYFPEPAGMSKITDFNPTVHLILEPEIQMTGETLPPTTLEDGTESDQGFNKVEAKFVRHIEKLLLTVEPNGDKFAALINDCLLEGMECLTVYERWSRHPELNKYEKVLESWDNRVCQVWEQPDKLYLDCDEWLVENDLHQNHGLRVNQLIKGAFDKISLLFESYRPYLNALWENEQIDFSLLESDRLQNPVDSIYALIERFLRQKQEFEEFLPDSREVGMLRVDCSAIKTLLLPSPKDNLKELQILLPRIVKDRIEDQKRWLKKQITEIRSHPVGVQEYVKQIQLLDHIDAHYQSHKDYIELNSNIYNVLLELEVVDAKNKAKRFMDEAYALMRQLESEIALARDNADKKKHEIKNKIVSKIGPLNEQTSEFLEEMESEKYLDIKQDLIQMISTVDANDLQITRLNRKKTKIQNYQKTLDMGEISRFDNIEEASQKHKYRKQLWHSIQEWTNMVRRWESENFDEINVDDIQKQAEQYSKLVIQCERNLPQGSTALTYLKTHVNDFKETMPIVRALGNRNLKEEHWLEIKTLLNMLDFPLEERNFTLGELMGFKVSAMQEEIENISVTATQESKLSKQILDITETWNKTEFDIEKYREKDYILSGIDKVVVILDESLSEISDIQGSRYVKRLISKVQKLQEELLIVSETIEQWRECQRNWIYLENIFSSKDIRQQRAKDYQEFESVNRNWNKLMKKVSLKKNVLKNCTYKQYQEFIRYNEQMDRIQKNLEVYLEEKRTEFPRFYFISNDELLQLLAEQKVVSQVEKHLNKCFDNVVKLFFNDDNKTIDDDNIYGVVSAEGERLTLFKPQKKHNLGVEAWLGHLKKEIKKTVNYLIKQALNELNKEQTIKQEWVMKHCGQAVTVVSKIKWTEIVEEALLETEEDATAISNLAKQLTEDLSRLVDLIRTPSITDVRRKILVSLITQEVHGRSIVEQLSEQRVESVNDFQWQQCLRYYDTDNQKSFVQVRQVNAVIKYGCEYMGATSRLVITPLTDRCWLTITGALHIKLGASPQGPAGTGKTESTKDLAKALGIFCVVFNCSEQVEYKMMARLFSGLIQSGAWSCLDEFNRIDVEVLSVIAQQLLDIRQAKLSNTPSDEHKPRMLFNDKLMPLKQNCGVFVTMNPGYAGRAELPDNLKVLFRPVAMMIPSYGLVAQVMLFAEGYNDAQKLSTKMVQLYKLSDEQLSQQDHYDFGMRAVKSVLVIAGNLKRTNPELSEDVLLIRAMRDANVPKFLADDLPLFNGIVQDLFPNVTIPDEDQTELGSQIEASCQQLNLLNVKGFKLKCLQLFDTFNVRFGVMLVGPTGGGKSTCFSVLQHAITQLESTGNPIYKKVKVKILNPKSISMGELYGEENKDTKEWTDGLASKIIRKSVEDKHHRNTWTVFDGPVDALWIENMNTVLDDNMTLCLANGERIKLKQSMRILFEVQDLKVASPATVSRCGMVYMTPSDLGWKPYVHQWMNYFIMRRDPKDPRPNWYEPQGILPEEARNDLQMLFDTYVEEAFTKLKPFADQQQLRCEPVQIVKNICNFLETFLTKPNAVPLKEKREIWIRFINAFFGFSFIWAFGAHYKASAQRFIDNMMRDFFSKLLIPTLDTVFDYYIDEKQAKFIYWKDRITEFQYPSQQTNFFQLFVPTVDTERTQDLLKKLTSCNKPVFITGNTGTGKSLIIQQFIRENKEPMELTPVSLNFSAQTTSASTQLNIESKLIKKRQKVFGAKGNSKTLIFIDDINMPAVEQYGAQPPIELLRQLIDHGGMYDRPNFYWKKIEKFSLLCAAAPPSGGRSELTPRFMRHFFIQNIADAQDETLYDIFEKILSGFLHQEMFNDTIKKGSCKVAIHATIDLYNQITKNLLPIPAKFHYTFNLRDIAKVFQGILMTKPISVADSDMFAKLWLHEASRVFADRLCTPEDIGFFQELATDIMLNKFKYKGAKKELLFAQGQEPLFSVLLRIDSDLKYYELIEKKTRLLQVLEDKLTDYNFSNSNKMDLVFFDDAIKHVIALLRILMQPRGNAMLIGVSGSGKQTLTKLAASTLEHECLQIKLSKNFTPADFREVLKEKMLPSGCEGKDTTFILNDTQIMYESFLEDVNNILNTGEITNLYQKEDYERMNDSLTKVLNRKKVPVNKDNIYDEYIEQLRDHFHIILSMSPVGDLLRNRCRKFPSLVNCCTLDWFFSWPEEALLGVAEQFLRNVDPHQIPQKQKKILANLFPKIHRSVEQAADRFAQQLRRKTYVTPKSYLDGINLYISHLQAVTEQHEMMKTRYENGVTKLNKTNIQIEELKVKLTELIPKLEEQNKLGNIQVEEIRKNKAVAQQKELEAESDAAIVRMDAQQIEQLKREAENELANAAPALEAANKAVDSLDKNDVADLKQTKNPTIQTEVALKCILTYLGYSKPDWPTAQKTMADIGFLGRIKNYDKQNIDPKIIEKVKKIVTDKATFNLEKITQSNRAAGGLARWCVALYRYAETLKIVQPIEANVKRMSEKYQAAMKEVEKKQAEVQAIREKLKAMEDQLDQTMQYIFNLQSEKERCEKRLVNAGKLIELLTDEGKRWEQNIVKLKDDEVYFAGNVFIAAATLSYLGPFNGQFREDLVDTWKRYALEHDLEFSIDYSLKDTLGDPVQIRNWNLAGLPSDEVSIDNAILAAKTSRWPLMIDPEGQANKWIKRMFKNPDNQLSPEDFAKQNLGGQELVVLRNNEQKGSKNSSQKQLEHAIIRGLTVLVEDVGADLDPGFDSILTKALFQEDGVDKINFGDKALVYDPSFRFLMTSKLPNPHFLPETCIKTTVINFSVTFKGLEDQLLVDVINNLQPDLEIQRDRLVVEIAQKKNDLFQKQSWILKELAESNSETILDNEFLIETLEIAKHKSINTKQDLDDAEKVESQIEKTRNMHREVAVRGSILYFCIVDMSFINEMYQNSLQYFKKLFNEAIEKVPVHGDTKSINTMLKDSITLDLYQKICIGLFEEHKIVYAFLICTSIKRSENKIQEAYWNLLLRGALLNDKVGQPIKPDNLQYLVTDAQWDFICALQKISQETVQRMFDDKPRPRRGDSSRQVKYSSNKPIDINVSQYSGKSGKEENKDNLSAFNKHKNERPGSSTKRINIDQQLGFDQMSQMSGRSKQSGRSRISGSRSRGESIKSQHNVVSGGSFVHLCREIEENPEDWDAFVQGFEPFDDYFNVMPCNYGERLTPFEKLLLIKVFKPEKIAESMTMYLEQELGPDFATSPVSSIENLFKASDCGTPIIFVLSQGVDPTFQIIDYAKKFGSVKLMTMSLGQGQEKHAMKLIEDGKKQGHWVMLQNCHLFKSWMPVLAAKVNELQELRESPDMDQTLHPDFKLILTSMPVDYFPTSVLQTGLKFTTEPPRGIKNNLQRSYMNIVTQDVYDQLSTHFEVETQRFYSNQESEVVSKRDSKYADSAIYKNRQELMTMSIPDSDTLKSKNKEWRNLLFGLAFFHAVIQERRKFGPLGWNIFYEFSDADLVTSITMVKNFLLENEDIPWDAMKFMTGQINYGGRVTDDFDRQLLMTMLQIFQNDDLVSQDNYRFSSSGNYYCPIHETVDHIQDYIHNLPNIDLPEIFGMHANAQIAYLKNESQKILSHVLNVQPRVSPSGQGISSDTLVLDLVKTLQEGIPELIDTETYHKDILKTNAQGLYPCFSTVLFQEVLRYNLLLKQINQTLADLQQAVKGTILMSSALDLMYSAILKSCVPKIWQQVSYPSLKPLGSWIEDLKQRISFMRVWAKTGHPKAYWLSGFFFPHGFITGILQTYARKHHKPIDLLHFQFSVLDVYEASAIAKVPQEGVYVYGLFMENATWSCTQRCLVESQLGEMNSQMPVIHFQPHYKAPIKESKKKSMMEEEESEIYKCPVYKTNERAGVLSTTGKSTNFILTVDLPCVPQQETESVNLESKSSRVIQTNTLQSHDDHQLIQPNTPEFWMLRGVAMISMLNE